LFPVFSCHGLEITTIEGLGDKKKGYHPLQKTLSQFHGTECGYCSPGQIMNMHSLLESSEGQLKMEHIENSFGGNLCRCTGYRPILDAFKSVAVDATEELKSKVKDIEDLDKICSKTGEACSGKCNGTLKMNCKVHMSDDDGREWFKVSTIQEILDIFNKLIQAGDKKYMLVHGNTAHGVYRRDPNIQVFIDITSVDELHSYTVDNEITLGANVSLTETMRILERAVESHPKFEYCRAVVKHIDLVANVGVRNVGTLAGNLSIKHEHNEFPSDIFLLLETIGAVLTIGMFSIYYTIRLPYSILVFIPVDQYGKSSVIKTSDFLKFSMMYKLLTKIKLPPLPSEKYIFKSYKVRNLGNFQFIH